jgi:DNA-binding XRE family transcriptional regulator
VKQTGWVPGQLHHVIDKSQQGVLKIAQLLIAQGRTRRQMTQRQVEKATGIPQSEISRIESGRANPTLATLRTRVRSLGGEIRIVERPEAASAST